MKKWQQKLSNVESILQRWIDVQVAWISLQAIFLSSEDIRRHLPDIVNRFDRLDHAWRRLQVDSWGITNVVESTNRPNLGRLLDAVTRTKNTVRLLSCFLTFPHVRAVFDIISCVFCGYIASR